MADISGILYNNLLPKQMSHHMESLRLNGGTWPVSSVKLYHMAFSLFGGSLSNIVLIPVSGLKCCALAWECRKTAVRVFIQGSKKQNRMEPRAGPTLPLHGGFLPIPQSRFCGRVNYPAVNLQASALSLLVSLLLHTMLTRETDKMWG